MININLRAAVTGCLICFLLGAWAEYTWGPRMTDRHTVEKQPIVQQGEVRTETKIQYVPGETVYITMPGNSEPVPAKLDGKFDFGKPEFIYSVNGKPGRFTKADDERYVFDKNMVAVTQVSTIRLEADIPTIDKTRQRSLGGWYTNHGAALSVGYAPKPFIEYKGLVGVPDPKKLYGAGMEIRF